MKHTITTRIGCVSTIAAMLAIVITMFTPQTGRATMKGWMDDYEKALATAKETKRPVLANFSGSDWCGWCIRLDKEVFRQDEFKTYAAANLILFNADFPSWTSLPEKTARQNENLARKFGVEGFPTVFLIESDGTVIAKTGYQPGGAKAYIEHLKGLLAARKQPAAEETSQPGSAGKVTVSHRLSAERTSADGTFQVAVALDIAAGWHLQAAQPSFDYLVPTRLTFEPPAGARVGEVEYPAAKTIRFAGENLAVYDGRALLRFSVSLPPDFASGRHILRGTLTVQACDDNVCLTPSTVAVAIPFDVVAADSPAATNSDWSVGADDAADANDSTDVSDSDADGSPRAYDIARLFDERGTLPALLAIFAIGLALNLTPCVYPMLSVTVSIFGAQTDARAAPVFFKALMYVLGIATMYSALGVGAAMTGGLFGGLMQSPLALATIAVLLAALALSMFGLYEIRPPAALMNRLGGTTAVGLAGIYISGLVVGVFAAPCIGPPIIALLAMVGARGDPWFGFGAFFVLSLGLGAPYLILGAFSGLLKRLPKSGAWMVWVKKVFGVALLGVAAFYAALGFAPKLLQWIPPTALFVGGIYLGFLERSANERRLFRRVKWAVGLLSIAFGAALAMNAPKDGIRWDVYSPDALETARAAGRPVIMDFYADWCIPCHELDRLTFSDSDVIKALTDHVKLKVNLTSADLPESKAAAEKFGVQGVPTVVFLDEAGIERPGARILGFLPPREFMAKMKSSSAARGGRK